MRRVRIHTDSNLILPDAGVHWLVRPLLNPSLAEAAIAATDRSQSRPFDQILFEYNRIAGSLFELSSLEDCDFALVPVNWEEVRGGCNWFSRSDWHWIDLIRKFAERARRSGKPVVIFFSEDRSHEPVPVPGAVVFRHAMYRSKRTMLDQAMPVLIYADLAANDPGGVYREPREWQPKPVVGFCGFSRKVSAFERLKSLLAYQPVMLAKFGRPDVSTYRGIELRHRGICILEKSDALETNFLIRNRSVFLTGDASRADGKEQARREYLNNIAGSDYQFCIRGSANFSRRPWETLCCGRLPLFVDTDCVLPFNSEIDWGSQMPIIDESDMERMPELLLDFHTGIQGNEYVELQGRARILWEKWLTPNGFAKQLHRNFKRMIVEPSKRSLS